MARRRRDEVTEPNYDEMDAMAARTKKLLAELAVVVSTMSDELMTNPEDFETGGW